ncbi:tRNA(m(1)G37)methyltransferase [Agyrium rufum]|nr:tRNA(m(1)G37)methyltransferase [Agyrium rufum]
MFDAPVNRSMLELDRNFFRTKIPLAAARVLDHKWISPCRKELGDDVLRVERLSSVRPDPHDFDPKFGTKLILLRPEIKSDDPTTWDDRIQKLVAQERIAITPYSLDLNYDYWNYSEIMKAILPEEALEGEVPSSFSVVGHVAHLNLRDQWLPYKHLIAAVIMDKNPTIRTVINKLDEVGDENEFRTFRYELLAGEASLQVEVHESNCVFHFDYAKVYWNSRLQKEHQRLIDTFQPYEAVCDVMAGVGPFAVPAGKKKAFAWANDLNPAGFRSLQHNIKVNKVGNYVRAFNMDGRDFIKRATEKLMHQREHIEVRGAVPRHLRDSKDPRNVAQMQSKKINLPQVFSCYVMNLPATAITFLDAFIGIFHGHDRKFAPLTAVQLPMIHVYCFSTKSDDNAAEKVKICAEISAVLQYEIKPSDDFIDISDVRDVAPLKRMFRASFRLPPQVAFRKT